MSEDLQVFRSEFARASVDLADIVHAALQNQVTPLDVQEARNRVFAANAALRAESGRLNIRGEVSDWSGLGMGLYYQSGWFFSIDVPAHDDETILPLARLISDVCFGCQHFYKGLAGQ